jgi:hypothetical protein
MDLIKQKLLFYLLLGGCALALFLGEVRYDDRPNQIPPDPLPSATTTKILSSLDPLALYYFYSLKLLHAGDLHGHVTPLDHYDYGRVLSWLNLLVQLNPASEFAPFLATFYFGSTHDKAALRSLIEFLVTYAALDKSSRWRWHSYGVYLAHHQLRDFNYADQLIQELRSYKVN